MATELARKKRRVDRVRSVFDEFLKKHDIPLDAKDDFLALKHKMEIFITEDNEVEMEAGNTSTKETWGELVGTIEKLKFLSPRGQLRVYFYEDAVVLQVAKKGKDAEMFSIPHNSIEEMILLEDQKDSYVCIPLNNPMKFGKRNVGIVLIAIDPDKDTSVSLQKPVGELGKLVSGKTTKVIKQLLEATTNDVFSEPDKNIFQACDGSTHVKCCIGAREGCLYPLTCGMLFITAPLKYFPRKSILEIAGDLGIGRRTFDIGVYTEDSEKPFIFSMVPREEQTALTNYRRGMKIGIRKSTEDTVLGKEEEIEESDGQGSDSDIDIGEEMEMAKSWMARDHQDLAKDTSVDYSSAMDKDMLELCARVKSTVPEEDEKSSDETE